jgi:hypothetical protein
MINAPQVPSAHGVDAAATSPPLLSKPPPEPVLPFHVGSGPFAEAEKTSREPTSTQKIERINRLRMTSAS